MLDETVRWLRSHAYDVKEFDAGWWKSDADMYADMALRLDFPDYFGRNLDALNDCMSDVASGDYGWRAETTGLVIVLRGLRRLCDRGSKDRSDHARHPRGSG